MAPLPNCEKLHPHFTLGWELQSNNIIMDFKVALADKGYAAFGLSGSTRRSAMVGGQVIVVYLDAGMPVAKDFDMSAKSQCSQGSGVCEATNQQVTVLSSQTIDGITTIRVNRSRQVGLKSEYNNGTSQYVIWAMGSLNSLMMVTKHAEVLVGDLLVDFGRAAGGGCPAVVPRKVQTVTPWAASRISGLSTQTFTARLGPTGGKRGYSGITGQQSWGIAWYVNDLLIPELTVLRGQTYTFIVQGGRVANQSAAYHPLYITDDPVGGYGQKTAQQRQQVEVFAGVNMTTGNPTANAVGDLCEYTAGNSSADQHASFNSYLQTLRLDCPANGTYGSLTWTPDSSTPDTVYYQCWTHNYLGWKIRVVNTFNPPRNGSSGVRLGAWGWVVLVAVAMATRGWGRV